MSLEAVRRLAWTAIILFIMAIVFAFNHGPILAWLAANHTPLLVGLLQSPLWLVAVACSSSLDCNAGWTSWMMTSTPFAIGMHALGIMLGIGWWAAWRPVHRISRPTRTATGCWAAASFSACSHGSDGPAPEGGQGGVSEAARPDSRLRGHVHRQRRVSEEQRGRRMMDECERLTYVSGEAACNTVDIATALGGGFHVSFPPGRGTMTLIESFPDGSDVSIEVGDDRAAASNSRFETFEWGISRGRIMPQKPAGHVAP